MPALFFLIPLWIATADLSGPDDDLALLPVDTKTYQTDTDRPKTGSALPNLPRKKLTLPDLFSSIDRHAPQIEIAKAAVEEATGAVIGAEGFYDTRVYASYYGRLSGFYEGQSFGGTVTQQLPDWNAKLYGGYRRGTGGFPLYEDQYSTNPGGEIKVGGEVSLMRNRDIDANRLARLNTRLGVALAEQDITKKRIALKALAAELLADWLFYQVSLDAYKDLYAMAMTRQDALTRASQAGNVPELTIRENQQLILSRQSDILDAESALAELRGALAILWRDADGNPVLSHLPTVISLPETNPHDEIAFDDLVLDALARRPELVALGLESRQIKNRLGLAENDEKPDLVLGYEMSRDFGSVETTRPYASASPTRAGTDTVVQLRFSLPIGTSAAKGQQAKMRAKLKGLSAKTGLIEDQIRAGLAANATTIAIAKRKRDLADAEVTLTENLFKAEEKRFTAGLSSFFELNVLERRLGDAKLRKAVALRSYYQALIDYMRIAGQPWFTTPADQ